MVTAPPLGTQRMIRAPDAASIRAPSSCDAGWPVNWASASLRQVPRASSVGGCVRLGDRAGRQRQQGKGASKMRIGSSPTLDGNEALGRLSGS